MKRLLLLAFILFGSVAFGAVARVVWVTAATENEDGERMHVLARAKSNIGPDDGGFSYAFEQVDLPSHPGITASKVEWGTPLVGRARDLLAAVRNQPDFPIIAETYRDCLRDVLDLEHLNEVLQGIEEGRIRVTAVETATPSPLAAERHRMRTGVTARACRRPPAAARARASAAPGCRRPCRPRTRARA